MVDTTQYMEFSPGVFGVYKQVGQTPLEAINQLKKEHVELVHTPLTYAGRLDPMAEGLLLMLNAAVVKNKEDFLKLDKTYEATIIFGTETDSFDLLGIPTIAQVNKDAIRTKTPLVLENFTGTVTLPLPPFSSPPLNGKPLFVSAQKGLVTAENSPTRTTTVYSIRLEKMESVTADSLLQYIETTVPKVHGNFRTEGILHAWKQILTSGYTFTTATITAHVSHGTYMRSLAYMLGKALHTHACLFTLKRTTIGPYHF